MSDLPAPSPRRPLWAELYVQVFAAMVLGALVGWLWPAAGTALKPLGDAFIALVKMMIAPIVFCTVVHGIGAMRDMGRVGRIGLKALVYFELVSTVALVLGLLAGHLLQPGAGFGGHVSPASVQAAGDYAERAHEDGVVKHLLAIIPTSFGDALARGDLLQTLLVAILSGAALTQMGDLGSRIAHGVERAGQLFFRIIGMISRAAPVGAFGAMAYTVGAFGAGSLVSLARLVGAFALVDLAFILVVLGAVAALAGFSILRLLAYLREELLIVFGTSSSETALPGLLRKLERAGVSEPVVGLVVPTGYSFNLDGTNIYMTLAILFLAQATGTHLGWEQEAAIVGIAMLTSKGASGVTGAGFVTLAATLTVLPAIPVASIGMLLGIDRFMSLGRSLTNLVGNGVATIVIAAWEGELDRARLAAALRGTPPSEADLARAPAEAAA